MQMERKMKDLKRKWPTHMKKFKLLIRFINRSATWKQKIFFER